jgi:TPP-dependent indolepyruvate ferredoxin oxidoreductase alpha subunit
MTINVLLFCSGTKRVWIPNEKEAYIEVEVKELDGDKATVETKDGRVGSLVVCS